MITLQGHSGCTLKLIDSNTVRKCSKDVAYNSRLLSQIEKQKSFHHPTIKTPQVQAVGNDNGLVYFDMEYIQGQSFTDFCCYSDFNGCKDVFSQLLLNSADSTTCCKTAIFEKCRSLANFPLEILDLVDWYIPTGYCHGDLTFENIIIQDNSVYLIDFLDSFVDSPLIDQGKLMQDTFSGWSFRNKNYIPWHNLYLLNEIIHSKRNYIILLIHLYRILPYANKYKQDFTKCNIHKVTERIKKFL